MLYTKRAFRAVRRALTRSAPCLICVLGIAFGCLENAQVSLGLLHVSQLEAPARPGLSLSLVMRRESHEQDALPGGES